MMVVKLRLEMQSKDKPGEERHVKEGETTCTKYLNNENLQLEDS